MNSLTRLVSEPLVDFGRNSCRSLSSCRWCRHRRRHRRRRRRRCRRRRRRRFLEVSHNVEPSLTLEAGVVVAGLVDDRGRAVDEQANDGQHREEPEHLGRMVSRLFLSQHKRHSKLDVLARDDNFLFVLKLD